MNLPCKLFRGKKAFSAVISTLILMLIAVAAGVVIYSSVMGWLGDSQQTARPGFGLLEVDSLTADSTTGLIKLYVRNAGGYILTLDKIYLNGVAAENSTNSPAVWTPTLSVNEVAYLQLVWNPLGNGEIITVNVVCINGVSTSASAVSKIYDITQNPVTPTPTPLPTTSPTATPTPAPNPSPTPGVPVTIKFSKANLNNVDTINNRLTIDGVQYSVSDLSWREFTWISGQTHTITAPTPITGWDSHVYDFANWTNGNGLTTASGTFTVPSQDTTVTANYQKVSYTVRFATTGVSNYNDQIVIIDDTTYTISDIGWRTFIWVAGSEHSVEAITPVKGWDNVGHMFADWTNGFGLTEVSGTLTMPDYDTVVTANYVPSTVHVSFEHSGLSNLNAGVTVLTIDGVNYDFWQVSQTNFQWDIGSTHTVVAASPLTGWDNVSHVFQSWTNGNGLTGISGTITVPSSDVSVTVNYVNG